MAITLDELQKKYTKFKTQITRKTKQSETQKKLYEELREEYNALLRKETYLNNKINSGKTYLFTLDENSNDYKVLKAEIENNKSQLNETQKSKKEKEEERNTAKEKLEEIESKLIEYKEQFNSIKETFAKDPIINQFLQQSIESEYNTKINKQKSLIESNEQKGKDLKDKLENDQNLRDLVEKLKNAKPINFFADKNSAEKYNEYVEIAEQLREAVKNLRGFTKITLSNNDIEAIINDETDKLLLDEINFHKEIKEKLEKDKESELKKLKEKKNETNPTLASKKEKLKNITEKVKSAKEEIENIEESLSNYGYDLENLDIDKEIEYLNNDSSVKNYNEIKENFDNKKGELLKTGYITTEALEALGIDTGKESSFENLYNDFFEADHQLRKKFLEIKGRNIENPDGNDEFLLPVDLQESIEDYNQKSKKLEESTGFSVKSWHEYLLRDVEKRIHYKKDGFKHVPEEYATDLSKQRFSKFAKKYSYEEFGNIGDCLNDLCKEEEKILNGENNDYINLLNNYVVATNNLRPEYTKTALLSAMGNKLIKPTTKGMFAKIKDLFTKASNLFKNKFKPSYEKMPNGYEGIIKSFELSKNEMEEKLGMSASSELKIKKEKLEKLQQKILEKNSLELEINNITLEIKNGQNLQDDITIEDADKINEKQGTLYKDVKASYIKKDEDVRE